jgi:hypothetical protein
MKEKQHQLHKIPDQLSDEVEFEKGLW